MSSRLFAPRVFRFLAAACAFAALIANVHADTIVVTTTTDGGPDAPVPGSLRAALANANDGDVIDATGITGTISLMFGATNSATLVINKSVTIIGPGAANLTVDANQLGRVLHITPGLTVAIEGLSIINGRAPGGSFPNNAGGGIYNDHSALTVSNCSVSGNSAAYGAGISSVAVDAGTATLTVSNSTLSGNSAEYFGGGIQNVGGIVTVASSTLSGNSAEYFGGGIENVGGIVTVANSTLSGNAAESSGGIANDNGILSIGNTILRAGAQGANIDEDAFGLAVVSLGFNLSSDDGGGFLTAATDRINTDPVLGPLADNGGATWTHLPLPGSPAIDGGSSDRFLALGITTDQRGFARTVDNPAIPNAFLSDGTDIGAVEVQSAPPPPPPSPVADVSVDFLGADKASVKQGEVLTYTIGVRNYGPDTAPNVVVTDLMSSGTGFLKARATKGSFSAPPVNESGAVVWDLGDLANGAAEGAELIVSVLVKGKTTITNLVVVNSDADDPDPENNIDAITTAVGTGGSGGGGGKKK